MAAWGSGTFDNEDAQEWLKQLAQLTAGDLTTLLSRADRSDYLEAPESSVIVAAAEAIAALQGAPAEAAPRAIVEWVNNNNAQPQADVSALAIRAVQRVRTDSELKDLWLEADGLNEWSASLRNLEARLAR
ncbi:MAG: DUF4259 domain-containing protein [Acidobacteria bacterium]|nr:DUF4259 domain-containing protein [Acidobacteriota bacterium]